MKPGLCPDMPVMVNDWLSSTAVSLMSPAEEGAYFRLLCHAWNSCDCVLPDDDKALAALSRLGDAWNQGSGIKIRKQFQADPEKPGYIFNQKQRRIRLEQIERCDKARKQRIQASHKRWKKDKQHTDSGRNAAGMRPESGSDAARNAGAFPRLPSPVSPPSSPVPQDSTPPNKKAAADSAKPSSGGSSDKPKNPDHPLLIRLWCEAFRLYFGFDYKFQGSKDGAAVKSFLATGLTPEEIVLWAKKAWPFVQSADPSKYACRFSDTLTRFDSKFNEIRVALSAPRPSPTPNIPNI